MVHPRNAQMTHCILPTFIYLLARLYAKPESFH